VTDPIRYLHTRKMKPEADNRNMVQVGKITIIVDLLLAVIIAQLMGIKRMVFNTHWSMLDL